MFLFSAGLKLVDSFLQHTPSIIEKSQSPFEKSLPKDVKVLFLARVSFKDLARFEIVSANCKVAADTAWTLLANDIAQNSTNRTLSQSKEIVKKYYTISHALPKHLFRFLGGYEIVLNHSKSYCIKDSVQAPLMKNAIIKIKLTIKELKDFEPPEESQVVAELTGRRADVMEYALKKNQLHNIVLDPEGLKLIEKIYKENKIDPTGNEPSDETLKALIKKENPVLYTKFFPVPKKYFAVVAEMQVLNDSFTAVTSIYYDGRFMGTLESHLNEEGATDTDFVGEIVRSKLRAEIFVSSKAHLKMPSMVVNAHFAYYSRFQESDPIDAKMLQLLKPINPEFTKTVAALVWTRFTNLFQ